MVCPYSFDVPGGVQFHVRDLAEHLIAAGHEVSVLAPADDDTPLPDYVVAAGRAVPVPLQRLRRPADLRAADRRPRRPLDRPGPVRRAAPPRAARRPSVSLLALWAADGPVVATFHTSNLRSRAMQAAYPLLRPEPGEDQRPHRRLRGRPAHRHHPRRRRRRRHPQRRLRRPVRLRGAAGAVAGHAAGADDRVPRPDRRAPQGPAGAVPRAAAGAGGASRACACWSSATVTTRTARSRTGPRGVGRVRVPRRGQRRGQGRAAAPRSTSTSPRTPAARASASCWSRR